MKAILVIDDMPSVCTECPFYEWVDDDNWESEEIRCGIRCGLGTFNFKDEKPSWCPLKPLPKEEDIYEVGMDEEDTNAKRQWNKGWNACLKEIEK